MDQAINNILNYQYNQQQVIEGYLQKYNDAKVSAIENEQIINKLQKENEELLQKSSMLQQDLNTAQNGLDQFLKKQDQTRLSRSQILNAQQVDTKHKRSQINDLTISSVKSEQLYSTKQEQSKLEQSLMQLSKQQEENLVQTHSLIQNQDQIIQSVQQQMSQQLQSVYDQQQKEQQSKQEQQQQKIEKSVKKIKKLIEHIQKELGIQINQELIEEQQSSYIISTPIEQLQDNIKEFEYLSRDVIKEIKNKQKDQEEFNQQIQEVKQEKDKIQQQLNNKSKEYNTLYQNYQKLYNELQLSRQALKNREEQLQFLQIQNQQIQQQVAEFQVELDRLTKRHEQEQSTMRRSIQEYVSNFQDQRQVIQYPTNK